MRGFPRSWVGAVIAGACLLASEVAQAQGESVTSQCVADFDRAQTLREGGQLLEARKALESCSRAECPNVVTSKCVNWLEEVKNAIPSIVIAAKDGKGNDVVDVRVRLGDKILAETLDGRPIELDPGAHTLRFERKGAEAVEQQIVARQGEKLRAVEVRFGEPTKASEPPPPALPAKPPPTKPVTTAPTPTPRQPAKRGGGGTSPLVWIGFGLGGAGLVVGSVTGIMAFSEKSRLDDQCRVNCTQEDINKGVRIANISTAGFAVAGIGTVLGVVGLMSSSSDEPKEKGTLAVGVGPGSVQLSGRF